MLKQRSFWSIKLNLWFLVIALAACAGAGAEPETAEPGTALPANTAVPEPEATQTAVPEATTIAEPAPETASAQMNETFTLGGGQEIVIAGAGLHLRFAEVLEDSRCPTNVPCFWEGQAIIRITVQQNDQPPLELQFNSNPSEGPDTLMAYGYTVQLMRLDPYPEEPDMVIDFDQYQASLVVTRP